MRFSLNAMNLVKAQTRVWRRLSVLLNSWRWYAVWPWHLRTDDKLRLALIRPWKSRGRKSTIQCMRSWKSCGRCKPTSRTTPGSTRQRGRSWSCMGPSWRTTRKLVACCPPIHWSLLHLDQRTRQELPASRHKGQAPGQGQEQPPTSHPA